MVSQGNSESSLPMMRFQECLAAAGKRLSEPRRLVAERVFAWTGLFTADEVVKTLAAEVTRPSVYRTLSEIAEFGLIQRLPTEGGNTTYVVID